MESILQVRRDNVRLCWPQLAISCCNSRSVERRCEVVVDKHCRVPTTTTDRVGRRGASCPASDAHAAAEARYYLRGQNLAKARVEDGVDWEIDRRVGDD